VRVKRKGQVTIPSKLRQGLGIEEGDILEVTTLQGAIVLKPTPPLEGGKVVGKERYDRLVGELEESRRRWR